jgi:hypothetical protein
MSQTMIVMSAALAAELVIVLIVVLSVAYLRNRAARRRDQAAIQTLVARVRQERPQREQAIAQFLGAGLGYEGAGLSDNTVLLARAELQLLHRFALLYRDRNADLAGRFDGELHAMLDAYHALAASQLAESAVAAEHPAVDDAELEALRRENTRLSEELRITMETMSRMLNEYSTMFAPVGEPEAVEGMADAGDDPPGSVSAVAFAGADATDDWAAALDSSARGEGYDAAGSMAAVDVSAQADEADDGDWEVAVDAASQSDRAEDGEWEVAVGASGETDGLTFADEVVNASALEVRESEDPLAEVMRAAANQEKSAREALEAKGLETAVAADGKPARGEPAPAREEEVDLFEVVMEGTPTSVVLESESMAGASEESGEDLFDVVEAPRSRSAS